MAEESTRAGGQRNAYPKKRKASWKPAKGKKGRGDQTERTDKKGKEAEMARPLIKSDKGVANGRGGTLFSFWRKKRIAREHLVTRKQITRNEKPCYCDGGGRGFPGLGKRGCHALKKMSLGRQEDRRRGDGTGAKVQKQTGAEQSMDDGVCNPSWWEQKTDGPAETLSTHMIYNEENRPKRNNWTEGLSPGKGRRSGQHSPGCGHGVRMQLRNGPFQALAEE